MLKAKHLKTRPAAFQRLTGVTPNEFDTIVKLVTPLWNAAEQTRLNIYKRQRAIGAGAQFKLEVTARVLLVLIYLRQYCFLTPTTAPDGLGSHPRIPWLAFIPA